MNLPSEIVSKLDTLDAIGLIGACVARDFREAAFSSIARSSYIWRCNMLSLTSPALCEIRIPGLVMEPDEEKTFYNDINKTFDMDRLKSNEIILLDFTPDTYPTCVLQDGRFMTEGQQFWKYGLAHHLNVVDTISPYSAQFPRLWFNAFSQFSRKMNLSGNKIVILSVRLTATYRVGNKLEQVPNLDAFDIEYKNKLLYFMEQIASLALERSVLVPHLPSFATLDPSHLYGIGPFHYKRYLFDKTVEALRVAPSVMICNEGMTCDARERAATLMLECWEKEAFAGYCY